MSGRPPKPDEIKKSQNTFRPDRSLQDVTRKRLSPNSKPPSFLGKYARQKWRELVKELADVGLLSVTDSEALLSYCYTYDQFRIIDDRLQETAKHDLVGSMTQTYSRLTRIQRELLREMRMQQTVLGLTPSSRSRVSKTSEPPQAKSTQTNFLTDNVLDIHKRSKNA